MAVLANDLRRAEQHGTPPPSLIAQFRTYRFERSSGGFAINGRFFDLNVDNAVIRTGTYDVGICRTTAAAGFTLCACTCSTWAVITSLCAC
jgi:hypothetical protein